MILKIRDELNLNKIMVSGQCFRVTNEDEIYQFITKEYVLKMKELSDSSFDISCDRDTWDNVWHDYFDLDRDYHHIRTTSKATGFLKDALASSEGLRVLRQDPFEMVISFIISQRKSIPSIRNCVEYLSKNYGNKIEKDIYAFPTPEALSRVTLEELRAASVGYRDTYISSTATEVFAHPNMLEEFYSLNDDELFDALKSFKGVGDKVANCIMLFAYARFSRVPIDTWIKKIIENEYEGNNPFPSYGEIAGIIQQYAFYYITNTNYGS